MLNRMLVVVVLLPLAACGECKGVYSPPEIEMEITGTVHAADGNPIEVAMVALWDSSRRHVDGQGLVLAKWTAADGSYEMPLMSCSIGRDDDKYLEATAPGYQSAQKDATSCFQEVNFVLDPVPESAESGR